jgi:hypothetical protein
MSQQESNKSGVKSTAQKEDSARDLMAESKPRGNPVPGAFGGPDEVVESNHLEPEIDRDEDRLGKRTT